MNHILFHEIYTFHLPTSNKKVKLLLDNYSYQKMKPPALNQKFSAFIRLKIRDYSHLFLHLN